MASPIYVEEEVGERFDRCVTDGVLKFGGGAFLGAVFSLLFFKRRRWPVILGGGFGLGMAYSNCESELNDVMSSSAAAPSSTSKCQ